MAEFGSVQVRVVASRASLPLEGVSVVISRPVSANTYKLLAARRTDSSGLTEPVSIETPARAESLSPGNAAGFSYVDITADLPRYEQVIVRDVQVFPGIRTLQEIRMVPLDTLGSRPADEQEFTVTPQNL